MLQQSVTQKQLRLFDKSTAHSVNRWVPPSVNCQHLLGNGMPKQKQRITLKNTVPGWILPPDGLKLEVKAQRSWILLVFNICTFSWNVRSCVSQVGFSQSTKPSQQLHTCAVGKEAVSQGPSYCAPNLFYLFFHFGAFSMGCTIPSMIPI